MKKFFIFSTFVTLLGAGCTSTIVVPTNPPTNTETVVTTTPQPSSALTIIKLNPATVSTTIEYSSTPKFVSEWRSGEKEVVINGGFFHPDFSPSGYLVVNGERIGKRIFNQNQSGLISIKNNILSIRDLSTEPIAKGETFDYALQSYPFLITSSTGALTRDTGLTGRRTALGLDKEGNIYIIITTAYISLYEFMNQILAQNLSLVTVLNLDGGPSTGLYSNLNDQELLIDSLTPVPFVMRFSEK